MNDVDPRFQAARLVLALRQAGVTDHRVTGSDGTTFTLYKLEQIVGGDMDELITGVTSYFQAELLREAEGR